jgi:AcrR family transcriptional regulator
MSQAGHLNKVGRPRSEAARLAILDAAYHLLLDEGLGRLTVEAVARRARVGKPTIYRYWRNAQELAMAALLSRGDGQTLSEGGSARCSLRHHLCEVVAAFATNRGRQIALTLAASDGDSELAKAFRMQVILKSRETGRTFIEGGEATGELSTGGNIEVVLDMIYGPVFYRLLTGHAPLDRHFAEEIIDHVFRGIGVKS